MHDLHLGKIRSVLCIGAHPDDIEIGCGGTLIQLIQSIPELRVDWTVFSGDEQRLQEARLSASAWLGSADAQCVRMFAHRDSYLPADWQAIKEDMQQLASATSPDLVFTHRMDDRHQDHRILGELTWNAFRDHLILEYEIPKYEGDLGQPNLFVPLDGSTARLKIERLQSAFPSQQDKSWYDARIFESHLRMRGLECRAEFAEAFHTRKSCLSL